MTCYVVGAGASKSYEKSPTGLLMPLAKEFFQTFSKLKISENNHVLVGHILHYLKEFHGLSYSEFSCFERDIEELHSEVESRLNEALISGDHATRIQLLSVYNQLTFLFTSVINEIQNGNPSTSHINFIENLMPQDSIITFNWDTLIDRALLISGKWHCDTGYICEPSGIYRDGWQNSDPSKTSQIRLIKLHGSSNWLTSYVVFDENEEISFSHDGAADSFFVYESTTKPYPCYDGRYIPGYVDFSYGYYPPNLPANSKFTREGFIEMRVVPKPPFAPNGSNNRSD
ncbi:hypothetical protein [Desulfurispirillum indicum]|uniref:hypothetical protein n=1 Tax=Desulfurispirillum indicum TaxID=936456 RepID=UPI0001C43B7C|nr:hypothetical protein [Desulfurispirillum indicum]